nr:lipocalin-like domain-containing protein [uncultured Glaciecola sp.]
MGKLIKLSILLTVLVLFVVVVFSSNRIDDVSSNIEELFFNVKNKNSDSRNIGEASPQNFGRGLSTSDQQHLGEVADPNYVITFPKDHYSHASFDIEWWYLTANLADEEGNTYGLQWTLFRFRNPNAIYSSGQEPLKSRTDSNPKSRPKAEQSSWSNEHIYMAHASVHSDSKHWFSEKFARGDVGNAGVGKTPFKLFIDDWLWQSPTVSLLPAKLTFNSKLISNHTNENDAYQNGVNEKNANIDDVSYLSVQLNLSNTGPYVLQGQRGYSIKSADGKHASHYYSAPFIEVEGTLTMSDSLIFSGHHEHNSPKNNNKENETVVNKVEKSIDLIANAKQIAVSGNAWFDQEWTSQLLDQATLGWDWLSLHLDNGDKIMAFQMRLKDQPNYITGTYINADGSSTTLMPSDIELNAIELTPVGNKELPLNWQLRINSKRLNISIKTTKNDQWNPASVTYYEGTVAVSGTHNGEGFLELTGY